MSAVDILALENITPSLDTFQTPFSFLIKLEVLKDLPEDIQLSFYYVGSAEDEKYDQELV